MIEINLLPVELKAQEKIKGLQPNYLIYAAGGILGLLVFFHLCLGALSIIKGFQSLALNRKWEKLQPQRENLEGSKEGYGAIVANSKVIERLLALRTTWAEKLNKLSLNLPKGIWFNELAVTPKNLTIKASAISLEKEEVGLINKFINNLKNDAGFFKDFLGLELSSLQSKTVGGYDIVDFSLTLNLKTK